MIPNVLLQGPFTNLHCKHFRVVVIIFQEISRYDKHPKRRYWSGRLRSVEQLHVPFQSREVHQPSKQWNAKPWRLIIGKIQPSSTRNFICFMVSMNKAIVGKAERKGVLQCYHMTECRVLIEASWSSSLAMATWVHHLLFDLLQLFITYGWRKLHN